MGAPDDPATINAGIYSGRSPANTDAETLQPATRRPGPRRTCESLRLDLASAIDGKTWLLLPEGFRTQDGGKTYPLPTLRTELQRLIVIPLPVGGRRHDSGTVYVRRAIDEFTKRNQRRASAMLDASHRAEQIGYMKHHMSERAKAFTVQAREAVEQVRAEASKAIASLNDLFALGREGLGGIMKAHLAGEQWKGEPVTTDQFMGCFRMVSQAVKGLGLPSEQRDKARDAVMQEVANSIDATRAAISGTTDDEVQH